MTHLLEVFTKLAPNEPTDEGIFNAEPLPTLTNHRISKSTSGKPIIFLRVKQIDSILKLPDIKLKNFVVKFDASCRVKSSDTFTESVFTVISYTGSNDLQSFFLKICSQLIESLGNNPLQTEIYKMINQLVELLKYVNQAPLKSVQGLWAELLIIEHANNPAQFIKSWHLQPTEQYDFTYQTQHLEVKSTSSLNRQHHFSMKQLNCPVDNSLTIASVQVQQNTTGLNIEQLKTKIFSKISEQYELQHIVNLVITRTLGNSIVGAMELKFNYELAVKSIAFYKSENIPKIPENCIPNNIFDVRFQADLSKVSNKKKFSFTSE